MMKGYYFQKERIENILEEVLNRTLGEVDKKKVFKRTENHKKITGIAGDIIEQSVLGLPADNKQRPDLNIDGCAVELKTTGIKISRADNNYEAKEPMSITAVSPKKIIREDFFNSNFWHKTENMLIVYYHYDSDKTVDAALYANFYIRGYEFHKFSNLDIERLKNDWLLVRNFIRSLHRDYQQPKHQYSRLSSELREKLIYIDTAPKWPHNPRFRLKRKVVTSIVRNHFGEKLEQLPGKYNSFRDIDNKCNELTQLFRGMKVKNLVNQFGMAGEITKSTSEQIAVRMFGGESKRINSIELFNKIGLIAKTIVVTKTGSRTEDMKLMGIDFDEWMDDIPFENSAVYEYFSNNQLLCMIFEEPSQSDLLNENVFVGFKRLVFSDEFIDSYVRKVWMKVRTLVNDGELCETVLIDKAGQSILNKSGIIKTSINFPKSKDSIIFIRGTGSDSTDKKLTINGIRMYRQNVWLKGTYITNELKNIDYI